MSRPSRAARRASLRPRPRAPDPPADRLRLRPWQVAAALAALHLVLALLIAAPTPDDGGDNAAYLALARSLLEDGSYRELWDPAARPHTQYPPVWPLVLAGAMAAGIGPWFGFKAIAALFSAAAVAFAYLWARRVSTSGVALGTGLLLAVGMGVVSHAGRELSDVPFWTFTMLALWAFARWKPEGEARGAVIPVLATAALVLAYLTRAAALPMLAAAAVSLAWQRRWRALAVVAAGVGPAALLWALRRRALGGDGYGAYVWYVDPYRPELGSAGAGALVARVGRNFVDYAHDQLPFLLTGYRGGGLAWVLGSAVVALAATGWALRLRDRRAGLAEWWLPLYLGLVLLWPAEWAGERFLLPALPVLLVHAGEALGRIAAWSPRPRLLVRGMGVGAVGACLFVSLGGIAIETGRVAGCRARFGPLEPFPCLRPGAADFLGLARAVRGTLPAGSAVVARKPTLFWAESGYPSRPFPYAGEPDSLLRAARDAGARYVVLDRFDNLASIHLVPAIAQRPQAFCVMASVGETRATLLGILPGAEGMRNVRDRPRNERVEMEFDECPAEYWAEGGRGE